MDDVVLVDVLGSVVRHLDAGSGLSALYVGVEVGRRVQCHLVLTEELCRCCWNHLEDVAVANQFLFSGLTGVGQVTLIVPDTHGVIDECHDAHLLGQCLVH